MAKANAWHERRHAEAVTRYRRLGYRHGYAGRERAPGTTNARLLDVYRKAYRAGARAWLDDQAAELEAWTAAQAARS